MSEILGIVKFALSKVYDNHIYLIENKVSERSIVFWFGIYFFEIIKETEYSEFNLDVEYNRNQKGPKRTKNNPHGTYPDLILHNRGRNDNNILAIEFKPWWNPGTEDDLIKLQDFTNPDGEYKYEIGLSILIGRETPSGKIVKNGEVTGDL
ncbi:MAG: hypothetical protein E4G98_02560 [Promethearchaeota archaeon]|nr:MAG: hypothetical protein E4G98_02560 [Candidatus Lokiarchaeota archaeon]